jgi:hypothetical protein
MCRGMRIPAHDRHAGQREALFGADNMDNALPEIAHAEKFDGGLCAVLFQGSDLLGTDWVGNSQFSIRRRDVMVRNGEDGARPTDLSAGHPESFKGLGRSHFMDQVPINIEQGCPIRFFPYDMLLPNLVEQRFSTHKQAPCSVIHRRF